MISSQKYKKVVIHIRTYKTNALSTAGKNYNMEERKKYCGANVNNKFICSICLNCKNKDTAANDKKSAIVQKSCDICLEGTKAIIRDENKSNHKSLTVNKSVQTHAELNNSLSLLNEVLTVFQNKKQLEPQTKSKTIIFKDTGMSTENIPIKPKLSIKKAFEFSIDEVIDRNGKIIVASHEDIIKSQSISLPKYKSSSIPQMKLEELKNSLKEKTKSKDAIEEVNRMFANVRKARPKTDEFDVNRPLMRNGPRVLPVIKIEDRNLERVEPCKHCPTKVDCMSSGDAFMKADFCHQATNGKSDKCVYVMCCKYKNCRNLRTDCDCCDQERFCYKHRDHNHNCHDG